MRTRFFWLILLPMMFIPWAVLNAQDKINLKKAEQELKQEFSAIGLTTDDSARMARSRDFQYHLRLALNLKGADAYPWDSLRHISKLTSPDGLFRLYNWNVPLSGGTNRYFCLIRVNGPAKKSRTIALTDRCGMLPGQDTIKGDSSVWYGALYYKIIPFKLREGHVAYLLLGWNGLSKEISGKVIEVMDIAGEGQVVFGAPVFPDYKGGDLLRIIFSYSSSASMKLSYREQNIPGKPVWNNSKREYETRDHRKWMIVFDHLAPMDPQLEGQFRFYVPSGETAEGFVNDKFKWIYVREFEARNP